MTALCQTGRLAGRGHRRVGDHIMAKCVSECIFNQLSTNTFMYCRTLLCTSCLNYFLTAIFMHLIECNNTVNGKAVCGIIIITYQPQIQRVPVYRQRLSGQRCSGIGSFIYIEIIDICFQHRFTRESYLQCIRPRCTVCIGFVGIVFVVMFCLWIVCRSHVSFFNRMNINHQLGRYISITDGNLLFPRSTHVVAAQTQQCGIP